MRNGKTNQKCFFLSHSWCLSSVLPINVFHLQFKVHRCESRYSNATCREPAYLNWYVQFLLSILKECNDLRESRFCSIPYPSMRITGKPPDVAKWRVKALAVLYLIFSYMVSMVCSWYLAASFFFKFGWQVDYNDRPNAELIIKSKTNADLLIRSVNI